jgi:hypothetical protein
LEDNAGADIGDGHGSVCNCRTGGVMDGANQAAILILRSCGDATDCDQEANTEEGPKKGM